MDVSSIAAALVAAQAGRTQLAVAAKLMRMNADQAGSVAKLIEAAGQNADRLANVASGIGQAIDISA